MTGLTTIENDPYASLIFMKIKFLNKAVDAINLKALLRSTSVTDKIPVYFRDKEPPIVSYEYTSTVASKLFNFAPTLSNLNVSEYLSNSQTCQCKKSKFCYEPHGHVITGDLRVIENAKLRISLRNIGGQSMQW